MREVWITDVGVVTGAGNSLEATWQKMMEGRTAIRKIDRFPVKAYQSEIGATIPDIKSSGTDSLIRKIMDLLLGQMAQVPADSLLITSSTKAGIDNLEKIKQGVPADPKDMLPSFITETVATSLGLKGRLFHVTAACASSTVAVAQGAALITSKAAESVLVFCLDLITESVFSGFSAFQILSPIPCRPFDRDRSGLSVGEGGAFLMLMSDERARRLGRPPKGMIAGTGISTDARHITSPDRTGAGLIRAVKQAIKTAGIIEKDVAGISAHGTGTIYNDLMELTAFQTVFGKGGPRFIRSRDVWATPSGRRVGLKLPWGHRPYPSKPCRPLWAWSIRKREGKGWSPVNPLGLRVIIS